MNNKWKETKLGDILTERRETPNPAAISTGQIRIVSKIGFDAGKIELRNSSETNTKMITIMPGDLVLSGINAAKGAIAIYPEEEEQPAAATIHYSSYKVSPEKASTQYLWWLLRSKTFRDILNGHMPGGIKTELKAKTLLPVAIPLPSLTQQNQLVRKIDSFVGQSEKCKMLHEAARVEISILLKSYLNQLTQNYKNIRTLGSVLCEKPRNGWSACCDNSDGGTPILTLTAVTGYSYDSSAYKKTSLPTEPNAHYWLKHGDLLITRSNTPDLVGHAAIYNGLPERCIYPDLMMRIPVNGNFANKRFVWYWLQAPLVRDYIQRNAKGTSPTMKKISQGTVMNIPFPGNISLEEQLRTVDYLDGLQERIDLIKTMQQKTQKELGALMPSILDKAFKGEL